VPETPTEQDDQDARYTYLKLDGELQRLIGGLRGMYDPGQSGIHLALGALSLQQSGIQLALGALSLQQSGIIQSLLSESAHSYLGEIAQANRLWLEDMGGLSAASAAGYVKGAHFTWLKGLDPTRATLAGILPAAEVALSQAAYRTAVTERVFSTIGSASLLRALALPEALQRSIFGAASAYHELAGSLQTLPQIASLPAFVLPETAREVFTMGHALGTYHFPERSKDPDEVQLIDEAQAETSQCVSLLRRVDPALVRPYTGAHEVLETSNEDRTRHVLSSLRELWNHLVRTLAPDDAVKDWAAGGSSGMFHNGKPTRRARILYICRQVDHEPLADFVDKDTSALVSMVGAFNRLHELETGLTDEQVRALLLRSDSWLMYIVHIAESC
jgi:hypothetical protein